MATTILLVRHGQTAWNTGERFRGRADIPLNPTGRAQAEALARRLASEPPAAALFSSPLQRAVDTGRPVASALGLELHTSEALVDIDYGRFSGLSLPEARELYPEVYQAWTDAPHTVRLPGGESLAQVRARAGEYAWSLADRYEGERIILVTHLAVCRALFCYLLGLPESSFWCFHLDTASISEFRLRRGQATMIRANDTAHLAGGLTG
ncbi:MAG: histidine phosphatase family protein [Anaerolineae bacterium]|nr:histidine phosphatase family protein [Anaerolineae bacterium]